jgi:hypothetical protein
MRYSRPFTLLEDLCFFEFTPDTTPSEADNNIGGEAVARAVETIDLSDDVEYVEL